MGVLCCEVVSKSWYDALVEVGDEGWCYCCDVVGRLLKSMFEGELVGCCRDAVVPEDVAE